MAGTLIECKLCTSRGTNCRPESDRQEGEGAEASCWEAGSDRTASAFVLGSASLCLWWENLSGSSREETAAKAATAMAERDRWRGPEKEAIVFVWMRSHSLSNNQNRFCFIGTARLLTRGLHKLGWTEKKEKNT
jgi:hypothetical protein